MNKFYIRLLREFFFAGFGGFIILWVSILTYSHFFGDNSHNILLSFSSFMDSLRTLVAYWNSYDLWGPNSMNYYMGPLLNGVMSPVTITIVWIFISIFLLFVLKGHKINKLYFANFIFSFIIIGWLLLDLRWQLELWTRLMDTHGQYSKLEGSQKATNLDFNILQSSQKVLMELPKKPVRLFIIEKGKTQIYERYFSRRLMYYLLPHRVSVASPNIFKIANFDNDDFILFLNGVSVMQYYNVLQNNLVANTNLYLKSHSHIPAVGTLFRVSEDN